MMASRSRNQVRLMERRCREGGCAGASETARTPQLTINRAVSSQRRRIGRTVNTTMAASSASTQIIPRISWLGAHEPSQWSAGDGMLSLMECAGAVSLTLAVVTTCIASNPMRIAGTANRAISSRFTTSEPIALLRHSPREASLQPPAHRALPPQRRSAPDDHRATPVQRPRARASSPTLA